MTELAHSPKGASSAERWMNCPGSAILLKQLDLPQTDEPEYRALGVAAHEACEYCLRNDLDAEFILGMDFHGCEVDKVMADAVQTYLNFVRPLAKFPGATLNIEARIGEDPALRPHPDFYGTADVDCYSEEFLDIVDYKHGEGIYVSPVENPQMKYYAYGRIYERTARGVQVRSDRVVRLTIIQPRHSEWSLDNCTWETTVGELVEWAENELLPAMNAAEIDNDFEAGKWCRFCPAKLFCPLLSGIFGAAAKADPKAIPNFSAKRIGLEYQERDAVKFYMKALEDEVFRRNSIGHTVPGTKLVQKQAKRVWREEALAELTAKIGKDAFTTPALKSPAEIETLGADAKKLVKEYAYTPNTGLTVARESDRRGAVKVEQTADIFAHLIPADEPMENSNV
jgi:hypothetical protein